MSREGNEGSRASGSPPHFTDASLLRHAEEELAAALADLQTPPLTLSIRYARERLHALLAALREHHAELDRHAAEQEREAES